MDINQLVLSDEALDVLENGTWVDMSDRAEGVSFLVTGLGADEPRKLMNKKIIEARKSSADGKVDPETILKIQDEVIVEVVLKGWKGLTDNGQEVKFSKELARKWLMSKNGAKLHSLVIEAINRIDADAHKYVESVSKNSKPASRGQSKTQTQKI